MLSVLIAQNSKIFAASDTSPRSPNNWGNNKTNYFCYHCIFTFHWSWDSFLETADCVQLLLRFSPIRGHSQRIWGGGGRYLELSFWDWVPVLPLNELGDLLTLPFSSSVKQGWSYYLLLGITVRIKWVNMWEVLKVWHVMFYIISTIIVVISLSLLCSWWQMLLTKWHSWQVISFERLAHDNNGYRVFSYTGEITLQHDLLCF